MKITKTEEINLKRRLEVLKNEMKEANLIVQYLKRYLYHPIKNFIAKYYFLLLRRLTDIKVIGITGSAGKTTTKEMIASILKQVGPTVWSKANIDPVYNISSTILMCAPFTKYLVLEMGVEKLGEMDFYLWLAMPDIGVITNIYPTHTEFLKDEEGVLKEKSKLVLNLEKDGVAVLNRGDERLRNFAEKVKAKVVWFEGENDACAAVVGRLLGASVVDIKRGLENYERPKHRYEIIKHKSGAVIFDDSYNSNPEALLESLRKFNKLAGKNTKVAVIGDMLELGELAIPQHKRIGAKIKKYDFKKVFGVGKLTKYIASDNFDSWEKVIPYLNKYLKSKTYILIKGSRSVGLDRLVLELTS